MARIMIADDSDAIRMVLKDILVIGKHELVAEASNGMDAFEQFKKTNPDVVLLDVAMPKKDGLSVLRDIIAYKSVAKVIMITASDNQVTMKECISVGAVAYILKPFNFEDVLRKISEYVS
ncbi:MAG: response regulator [Thaumarchaeota archaeon]|nr:response regulator [Nitrososphaerota archaeon]